MQEELFDVVDEQGNPTGEKVTRRDAHERGIWHRTVQVYVFRKVGDSFAFLVHLRSKTKDQYPNMWITRFGGHVLAGDTIQEAAKRELFEEAGVDLDAYRVVEGMPRKSSLFPNNEIGYPFFVEVPEDVSVRFNDGEVQRVEWMTADEIIFSMETGSKQWVGSVKGFKEILAVLQERCRG